MSVLYITTRLTLLHLPDDVIYGDVYYVKAPGSPDGCDHDVYYRLTPRVLAWVERRLAKLDLLARNNAPGAAESVAQAADLMVPVWDWVRTHANWPAGAMDDARRRNEKLPDATHGPLIQWMCRAEAVDRPMATWGNMLARPDDDDELNEVDA